VTALTVEAHSACEPLFSPFQAKEAPMFDQLQYSVNGHWTAGGRGTVSGDHAEKTIEFSAPPEFHGEPGFWTPEHFLLAAVASCFITTFRAIAGYSKFDPLALDISVQGKLEKGPGGYDFTAIVIKPSLTIRDESYRVLAGRLLEKTERSCLIARSLKCAVTMEASIAVAPMQAVEA
jgi:organic hydroperoxide reductase OsmC/OhrA